MARRPVKIKDLWDLARFQARVLNMAYTGKMPLDEGKTISAMCSQVAKTWDMAEGPKEQKVKVDQTTTIVDDHPGLRETMERVERAATGANTVALPRSGTD